MIKTSTFKKIYFALPCDVKTAIAELVQQQELSNAQTTHLQARLINLCRYILGKYVKENIPFNEPIEISRIHFGRNLNMDYLKDLQLLKTGEIVFSDEDYTFTKDKSSGRKGRCKSYWFNPSLIFSDATILSHNKKYSKKFSSNDIEKQTVVLLSKLKLSIKKKEIERTVNEIVNYSFVSSRLLTNESIPDKPHYVSSKGLFMSKDRIISYAKETGLDAILYKNNGKVYLEKREQFIKNKVYEIRYCYTEYLLNLGQLSNRANIICNRNLTNLRLDTNLTNLPSKLFSLLRLDGEQLEQYDLSNSQFVILANLISATLEEGNNVFYNFIKKEQPHIYEIAKRTTEIVTNERANYNDLFLFINETRNGCFYECLANNNWKELYQERYPEYESLFDLESRISFHKYRSIRSKNPMINEIKYQIMDEPTHKKIAIELEKQYKAIRGQSKQITFETVFSSHIKNSESKERLKKAYPSLVLWINSFKRLSVDYYKDLQRNKPKAFNKLVEHRKKKKPIQLGSANLACSLQQLESKIFIDKILSMLLDYGFRVFSKHDSIACKNSQSKQVKTIVTGLLNMIFGSGNFKLSKG